jgi:hypothetical protein
MTRFPFSRQLAVPLAACALCLALAAPAGADENDWTSSSSFDGQCLAPVICPTVTNAFVPVGGADGDGYLSTAFTGVVGASAIAGTSTSVWESPTFVYAGNSTPRQVTLNRRASVDQLLAVEGNSADYSVQLRNMSAGGSGPTVIGPVTLSGADTWRPVPTNTIDAVQLKSGSTYRIRITTNYTTGTSVLVTGTADYDNIGLTPVAGAAGGSGNGNGKGGGRDSLRSSRLLALFSSGLSKTAVVVGAKSGRAKRLLVRVSCPKPIGASCRVTAQGLLRKRKPVTAKRTVKVGSGKKRLVALKVKPKFRKKVAKRKRLLVSEKVRAGRTSATAYKVRKLIRRK